MEKPQKGQKEWETEYKRGDHSPRDLYDAGFRPRSNKYLMAVKEWKYYRRHYSVTLTLSQDDYSELKDCPSQVRQEEEEVAERAQYDNIAYLLNKYGERE